VTAREAAAHGESQHERMRTDASHVKPHGADELSRAQPAGSCYVENALPEDGRRPALPRLPLVDNGLPCGADASSQSRLGQAQAPTEMS